MLPCMICARFTNKYKCSRCFDIYCSFACYKQHKHRKICLEYKVAQSNPPVEPPVEQEPTVHEPFNTEDTVPPESLARLRTATGVRRSLINPHLRQLLRYLDASIDVWESVETAMQEPIFVEFADECLRVVEPEPTNETRMI